MDGARQERRVTQCCSRFPRSAGPRGLLGLVHEVCGPGAGPRGLWGPVHKVCGGRSTRSAGAGPRGLLATGPLIL